MAFITNMNYTYSNTCCPLQTLQQKKTKKRVGSLRRMGRKFTKMLSKPEKGSKGSMKAGPKGNHHHRIAHEFWMAATPLKIGQRQLNSWVNGKVLRYVEYLILAQIYAP
jgi:hypothetical protein